MPTPSNRTPIRVARGTYNLNSSVSDIQEGRFVTLQIKISYYTLKKVAALSTRKVMSLLKLTLRLQPLLAHPQHRQQLFQQTLHNSLYYCFCL